IDLENIRSCRVERAQPHGFRSGLHDVGPSTRGGGGAAAEGRACGEEAARRHRRQQAKDAADTDEPPAGHAVRRQMGLEGVLVQLVHVLQAVTGRRCERRLDHIGLDHVLPPAVVTAAEQSTARSTALFVPVFHDRSPRRPSIFCRVWPGAVRRHSCDGIKALRRSSQAGPPGATLLAMAARYRILSLDGGGTWALIQARALRQIYGDLRGRDVLAQAIQRPGGPKPPDYLIVAFAFDTLRAVFFRSNVESNARSGPVGPSPTLAEAVHASSNAPVNYFDAPATFDTPAYLGRRFW